MNKWTLLLILIGLAVAGALNRDKIAAYLGQKTASIDAATPEPTATPNPAKESIARARQRYPQLAIANSQFNMRFVQLYNTAKNTDPFLLAQADWPMQLADRTAHDLNITPVTPTPPPTDMSTSALNARPPGWAGSTVPPSVQLPGLKGSALDQRPPAHR
jgi:hypothetical protein